MKFRKKPVVIEARQLTADNVLEVREWCNAKEWDDNPSSLTIRTLEGNIHASEGDWIIRGVKGEFYPCKPDIFEATYEPADLSRPAMPSEPQQVSMWVWRVSFPTGEQCYFGSEATAQAYARTTGTVQLVKLPERDFRVIDLPSYERLRSDYAKLHDRHFGTPCEQIERGPKQVFRMTHWHCGGEQIFYGNEIVVLKSEYDSLRAYSEALAAENARLREVAQEFVNRVESGEVKSSYTYSRFKGALCQTKDHQP